MTAEKKIASCTAAGPGKGVLYRELESNATKCALLGEELPRIGKNAWFPLAEDNISLLLNPREMYISDSGPIWKGVVGEIKVGDQINVKFSDVFTQGPHRSGLVCVTSVRVLNKETKSVLIDVEHIGEFDPKKLVHVACLQAC